MEVNFEKMMKEYLADPKSQGAIANFFTTALRDDPVLRSNIANLIEQNNLEQKLKLLVMPSFEEFGQKLDNYIKAKRGIDDPQFSYLVGRKAPFYNSGDCKVIITDSVRDRDVYILTDIFNYSIEYEMRGTTNHTSPNDNFKQLKDAVSATNGAAKKLTVIEPMLYDGRQHRVLKRESKGAANALRELVDYGIDEIITFDAHDPVVASAVNNCTFSNVFVTYQMLDLFINNEDIDYNNIVVVAPDAGATGRAQFYRNMLGAGFGYFYKRRDYNITNGNNIKEHAYIGDDLEGKNIIVVDDMLSSGGSLLDVGKTARERGANKIYFLPTFSLFDKGTESIISMNEGYEKGYFDKLYTTNLTYIDNMAKSTPWFREVDCVSLVGDIIHDTDTGNPIGPYLNGKGKILKKVNQAKKN